MKEQLYEDAVSLLKQLISTPSFSKEEHATADIIKGFLEDRKVTCTRIRNNVYARNRFFDENKPSLLLNSHHDTVMPNKGYTIDPFIPAVEEDRLFGLGSNVAGGCLVSLAAAFLYFYERQDLKYNIVFAASAEEEISGVNGIELLLTYIGNIDFAIVGEPTRLEMAVAERGLMVIDCVAEGRAGHAARNEGENALYKAMDDISWLRNYRFERISDLLGESRLTVTVIDTDNRQHNVVPGHCKFVIDARVNELYSFEEILEPIRANFKSSIQPRSTRLRSTAIA